MGIQSYRNLRVWQQSFDLVKQIYSLTRQLPRTEQFGLSSQMQRCAVSIPGNIAEGQQRSNLKEYKQFLGVARGSAAELATQLLLVHDVYDIDTSTIIEQTDTIQKMLYGLLGKLQ